jgi:hypothetical protein
VSDPAGIAAAAARAHMLLAEGHQPLTMTPGDLRALLARYQRRLQELADAVEPVTSVEGAVADQDEGLLFSLRAHRPGDYYIKVCEPDGVEKPGSTRDMRGRLTDLPSGHPSSPYNEDGSRKPPVLRLQDIELAEPEEDGLPVADDAPALADADQAEGRTS